MRRKISMQCLITTSVLVCSVLAMSGCAIVPQGLSDYDIGLKSRGTASWYGEEFHGRLTASGEIYDQHNFTAAHRMWPLGARVRVLNVRNGRQVEVLINDRGPFVDGRIIDLSYGAAEKLDMIDSGTSLVLVDLVPTDDGRFVQAELRHGEEWILSTFGKFGAASLATKWRGSARDVWFVPAGTAESILSWRPVADLRDERRSRRISDLSEELPPSSPLPDYLLPEEYHESAGDNMAEISV